MDAFYTREDCAVITNSKIRSTGELFIERFCVPKLMSYIADAFSTALLTRVELILEVFEPFN